MLTWGLDDDNRSYRIHAIGADGSVVSSELFDGPEALDQSATGGDGGQDSEETEQALDGSNAGNGCQVVAGTRSWASPWLLLTAMAILLLRRRHLQRP